MGGFDATLRDFEIPKRYGLRQTIADTLGVGGVFRALRTIPVVLAIADDMDELCPEAILLNYTNPMAMLCWSVWASGPGHADACGLCHSVQNTHEQIAEMIGVPEPEIEYLTAGVNHQAWVLRFERDGESLYPLLDEAIARDPRAWAGACGWSSTASSVTSPPSPASTAPSTCRGSCPTTTSSSGYRIPVDEYIRRSQDNLREYAEIKRQAGGRRAARGAARGRAGPPLHPRHGHRRRAHRVRQRPQRRPHRQPAGRLLRGGPLPRVDADAAAGRQVVDEAVVADVAVLDALGAGGHGVDVAGGQLALAQHLERLAGRQLALDLAYSAVVLMRRMYSSTGIR